MLAPLLEACVFFVDGEGTSGDDDDGPGCAAPIAAFYDADSDGWGDELLPQDRCELGDGFVDRTGDCDDLDPFVHPQAPEDCANGYDDDCDGPNGTDDGLVDCADTDCASTPACAGLETACTNGLDDDADGVTDCADPDCAADAACVETGDTGVVTVPGPDIDVVPTDYDFGPILPFYDPSTTVVVSNVGVLPLTVSAITEDPTADGDFGIYRVTSTYGPPPWVIDPGTSYSFDVTCDVGYFPYIPPSDEHEVEVASDDPDEPVVVVTFHCWSAPN